MGFLIKANGKGHLYNDAKRIIQNIQNGENSKKIKVARGTKKFNLVAVEKSFVLNTSKVQ